MTALENEPDLAVSSVTWGGQALARIDGTAATAGAFAGRVELWYLDEAGISAATGNTFAVTYGGTGPADAHHAAVTCESVEQGGPVLDSAASASPDGSVNPIEASVGAVAGGMTVAAAISGNTGSFDWGNGFSEGTDQNQASSDSSTADRSSATDGTETASATHSGPNRLAVVAASLTPSRVCADADGDDVCDGSRDQASCSRNSPTSLT